MSKTHGEPPYVIDDREEYEALKERGIDALYWLKPFTLSMRLRKELTEEIFGKGNCEESNIKYYKLAWKHSTGRDGVHRCEECKKVLPRYAATYISHRFSRGAYPEMAYDFRNYDLLCKECHATWENPLTRKDMRIYQKANAIMKILKEDYGDNL